MKDILSALKTKLLQELLSTVKPKFHLQIEDLQYVLAADKNFILITDIKVLP